MARGFALICAEFRGDAGLRGGLRDIFDCVFRRRPLGRAGLKPVTMQQDVGGEGAERPPGPPTIVHAHTPIWLPLGAVSGRAPTAGQHGALRLPGCGHHVCGSHPCHCGLKLSWWPLLGFLLCPCFGASGTPTTAQKPDIDDGSRAFGGRCSWSKSFVPVVGLIGA